MARPSPLPVLAVALLVAAAGCSGFGGGGPPDREPYGVPDPTPTPTRTATATETPTRTPVETVVPGITRAGVESALEAMRGHGLSLLNRSYEVRRTVTVRYRNGTVREETDVRAWVGRNRSEYLAVRTEADGSSLSVFADGRTAVSRTDRSGAPEYDLVTPPGGQIPSPGGMLGAELAFTSRIYLYLDGIDDLSVSEVTDGPDGTARYQISATGLDARAIDTVTSGSVSNVSVVIVANEAGLVESVWGLYTRVEDGHLLRVFERISFDGVGETTVPTPGWLDEARNATDTRSVPADANATDAGNRSDAPGGETFPGDDENRGDTAAEDGTDGTDRGVAGGGEAAASSDAVGGFGATARPATGG
jgi:hypothetical protein